MKKTAVEWLEKQLSSKSMVTKSLFEQAKELEKQQIMDAFYGEAKSTSMLDGEYYYNQTFKN